MACNYPIYGYRARTIGASGKRGITFNPLHSLSGRPMRLPCGRCAGCRLERSRQWAIRCMHEKQLHQYSSFVTLTYDDKHLPLGGSLDKVALQLFMKRLRKVTGDGLRFYACGEYGERSGRPHYHVLLFNYDFVDKRFYKEKNGSKLYVSKLLRSIWNFGDNVIGDVSYDSCAYVARYCMKKVTGPKSVSHYSVMLADGTLIAKQPEFTVMSRRPGIGDGWFKRFGLHAYEHDSVIFKGRPSRPPRFYDDRFEIIDSDRMERLRRSRRKMARLSADNSPDRRAAREAIMKAMLKLKGSEL